MPSDDHPDRIHVAFDGGAIAFQIYTTVTSAKAGVQRPPNEDVGNETGDLERWIPAFAGMTDTRDPKCDCPDCLVVPFVCGWCI